MNPKIVVILLVALTLSGMTYLLTSRKAPNEQNNQVSQDKSIIPVALLGPEFIGIGPDGLDQVAPDRIGLIRSKSKWHIAYPNLFPANSKAVDNLLELLASLEGYVEDEVKVSPHDIVDYIENGFQTELSGVALQVKANQPWLITLGERMGAGRAKVFLLAPDGTKTTYNTVDKLHDYFEAFDASDFYAKTLNTLLLPDIIKIEITSDGIESSLQQVDGRWWIGDPAQNELALEQGLPDAPGVSTYLELHNTLRLGEKQSSTLDEAALSRFGLDPPLIKVDFHKQYGEAWRLQVGVPADPEDKFRYVSYGHVNSKHPAVFLVDTPLALTFAQDASTFRDPRIMTTPRSLIAEMAIKNRIGHYTIRFMPNGIQFVTSGPDFTPNVQPHETKEGEKLAEVLSNLRAIESVDQDIEDQRSLASVVITPKLDAKPETIVVYPDTTEETVLIKINDEAKLRRVERSSVMVLLEKNFLESD